MPRFQARPVTVEAYPWTGNPTDMPEAFAAFVIKSPPPVGWFIVKSPGIGFEVVPPGPFEARFLSLAEQEDNAPREGEASVTYVGDGSDDSPNVLPWNGVRFVRGTAVGVSDLVFLAALRKNRHFLVVEPSAKPAAQDGSIAPFRRGPGRPPKSSNPQPNEPGPVPAEVQEDRNHG